MRLRALIKRLIQQMVRDKRTLALMFVAPLFILTIMYVLFNGDTVDPKLGVDDQMNANLQTLLKKENIHLIHFKKVSSDDVVKHNLDGVLQFTNKGAWKLTLQNNDPSKSNQLKMKVNQAISVYSEAQLKLPLGNQKNSHQPLATQYIYGNSNTDFFDVISPIFVGFFVFFFVFLISGIGLLKERTTGTLERVLATPIRRWEIVTSYLIGYGIFAFIQTVIVVLYSILVLKMVLVGSIWVVILINLLLALVALSLGTLLSAFAASEFQMIQFIPIIVVPQIFFTGIFPMEGMPIWLQTIGRILPMTYAADALKSVMYKGFPLSKIGGDLLILGGFALIFILLNILALKKYRAL
jgi:ABC-2 type transport system permease protein